jgi:GDPmannose 4,6-dehydratase
MRDRESLRRVVSTAQPDEVYNLAGISSVALSWQEPELTVDVNGTGVLRLLDVLMREAEQTGRAARLLQASSSEMFGSPEGEMQDESTPLRPRSPYAMAKAMAHEAVGTYRDSHGVFACATILFNHESPLRPPTFVTRKITSTVAAIAAGQADRLVMGNLASCRDWGSAEDYVQAMWSALQQEEPSDYVVATGRLHSIRDWLTTSFAAVGIDEWEHLVTTDPSLLRPTEPGALVGDASRARSVLGWTPASDFAGLVTSMVGHDVRALAEQSSTPA